MEQLPYHYVFANVEELSRSIDEALERLAEEQYPIYLEDVFAIIDERVFRIVQIKPIYEPYEGFVGIRVQIQLKKGGSKHWLPLDKKSFYSVGLRHLGWVFIPYRGWTVPKGEYV